MTALELNQGVHVVGEKVEGGSWSGYFAIISPQIRTVLYCVRFTIITRYGLLSSDAWLWSYVNPGAQIRPTTASRESGG